MEEFAEILKREEQKLVVRFDRATYILNYNLTIGGKLEQSDVDDYNNLHSQIVEIRDKMKTLKLEE